MNNLKDKGWVRIWRKIEDNPIWFLEPFTKAQAWIDLILNTNHKKGFINVRGNIVEIDRGQIGWSELTMAKRWKWSKNKVRRYLKWLETKQQIEQQKNHLTSIISIKQFEEYQKNDTTDDTTERPQTIHKQELKNVKNDKKEYIYTSLQKYLSAFNEKFSKEYKPTKGREIKLKLRLKTYSLDQILQSLDGLSKSKFHRGENDRGWQADPDFLIRSDEQVDKFLNLGDLPSTPQKSKLIEILEAKGVYAES